MPMRWGLSVRIRRACCAAALAFALLATVVLTAPAAARADDPSWSDVQAAKSDAKKKAEEVANIRSLLGGLEARAAVLGEKAILAAAASAKAEAALQQATDTLGSLRGQGAAAGKRATAARRQAAAVATQLYRSGDPTLSLWLSGSESESLLDRLGALSEISGSSSALMDLAVADQRQATALAAQAKVATGVRDTLAKRAVRLAAAAKAAETAANQAVADNKARTTTLEAKLKTLNATYRTTKSEYAAAQRAKAAAAAAGDGTGSGGSLGGISGGPGSLSPAGAQSYAASRIGAYGWSGSQFSCLLTLWNIESGWRWNAYNAASGAYGIPQSLPGSKMASAGGDWTISSATQIEWGLGYIRDRYGSPCSALGFETSHNPYWY